MRTAIKSLWSRLLLLAVVYTSLMSFTACSDNDEPVEEVTYSWEFEEVSPSTPDFMDDKNKIESTFKAALGVTGTATSVTKQGTPETCDQEVLEACQRAFDSLKDEVWQGNYVFVVTNTTTGTTICEASFNTDEDNVWNPYIKTYEATDLKIGDYYYSDGTWSDGGLRRILFSTMMEWAETIPKPKKGKTVIGIVFYVGHHGLDLSDYTKSGIGQNHCHGYVIALTDVHNDGIYEHLQWGYGPYGPINNHIGTYNNKESWSGYGDLCKIHEYVAQNNGWEMKHFPAFLACETYGNRALDGDGIPTNTYDWQHPLAAPNNSSGWFLPSCGQLTFLANNRPFLEAHMEIVKDNTPDESSYKEYIKGFEEEKAYWSSTEYTDEYPNSPEFARILHFFNGCDSRDVKGNSHNVRAVLAF